MRLNDYLQRITSSTVIYLGCSSTSKRLHKTNGSGFVYIGYASGIPMDKYGDLEIIEIYPHETDYPGTTILVEGMEHGSYWLWNECNPDMPVVSGGYTGSEECYENLLIAIGKTCIQDYRRRILHEMKTVKPTHMMEVDDIIKFCRMKTDLDFVKCSGIGEYLIQAVEDEARVLFKYPKARKMDYLERYEFLREKRRELQIERLKKQEKGLYATIKGRSVNHDVDG